MTSANFLELVRRAETTIGVAAVGDFENAYVASEALQIEQGFEQDDTIIGGRLPRDYIRVSRQAAGAAPFRMARGYFDWPLRLGMQKEWSNATEAFNLTADSVITDVVGATNTITVAGDWVEGMLVKLSGFTNAENNVTRRAVAGSGSGTLVVDGAALVDEAAPPAGARAKCVGIKGVTGDITATATGIASSALDFTTITDLKLHQVVVIGAKDAALNATMPSVGRDIAVVTGITPNAVTLAGLKTGWGVDAAAAEDIEIYLPDETEPGDSVLTDTFQKAMKAQTTPIYYGFLGVIGQNLDINFAVNSLVDSSITLDALNGVKLGESADAYDATPAAPYRLGKVMQCGANVSKLLEGDATVAIQSATQSLNFSLANNAARINSLGYDEGVAWDLGDAELTISGNYRFGDGTILDKFLDEVESSQLIFCERGEDAFAIRVYGMKYTAGAANATGRNTQVQAAMTASAKLATLENKMVSAFRFEGLR